jgi:hypothetical protein
LVTFPADQKCQWIKETRAKREEYLRLGDEPVFLCISQASLELLLYTLPTHEPSVEHYNDLNGRNKQVNNIPSPPPVMMKAEDDTDDVFKKQAVNVAALS